jgi:hypothetical protein
VGWLLGIVAAYRLAARLAGAPAGAAAATALLLAPWLARNSWLGNSEGLLVACGLWAVDRHLAGERRQALGLLLGAALIRPEAWPFLGLYGLWLWLREPAARTRALVAGALAAVPVLWLGPELWGSGDPFRAGERAQTDLTERHAAVAERPALEILDLAQRLLSVPVKLGLAAAALALALRWWSGERRALAAWLGGGALGWVAIVAAMTEAGYSGNQRYLILPAAAGAVLAGAGAVEAATRGGRALAARVLSPRARFAVLTRPGRRLAFDARARRGGVVAAAAVAALAFASTELDDVRPLARSLEYQARLDEDLDAALAQAGGRERVLACGRPVTGPYLVPALAWRLRIHSREVVLDSPPPAVFFRAAATGGAEPVPDPDPAAVPIARAGPWRVLGACGRGRYPRAG